MMVNSDGKFLTSFTEMTYFAPSEIITEPYFDISFINDFDGLAIRLTERYYLNGVLQATVNTVLTGTYDNGIMRVPLNPDLSYDRVDVSFRWGPAFFAQLTETKTIKINTECSNYDIRLTWLNNLGGFDYFAFNTKKQYNVDITDSGVGSTNIFPQWPNSYGEFADTINRQSFRKSNNSLVLVSPYVTQDELNALAGIKTSPLVQIINSRYDKRTVIVDTDSFVKFTEGDKLYSIQFTVSYTDDIPSQRI